MSRIWNTLTQEKKKQTEHDNKSIDGVDERKKIIESNPQFEVMDIIWESESISDTQRHIINTKSIPWNRCFFIAIDTNRQKPLTIEWTSQIQWWVN